MEQGMPSSGVAVVQVKLCECGCGEPAPTAKQNNRAHGIVKGQQLRFIQGHYSKLKSIQLGAQRAPVGAPAEPRLCECGCGRPTPIAKITNTKSGHFKGQHVRFIRGHSGGRAARPDTRRPPEKMTQMVKLCECGCGQPAPVSIVNNQKRGFVKGQPVRFIYGHYGAFKSARAAARALLAPPPDVKLCECGCGQRAPIAKYTNRREGCVKGQPRRFRWGHSTGEAAARHAAQLYPEGMPDDVQVCECGCGLPTPISPSNNPKRGYVKGEPRRFVAGHHRKLKLSVEVGQRFGRGVVIEAFMLPRQGKCGGVVSNARLRCDCGNEYVKTIYVLYNGSVKSCGCLLRSKGGSTPELVLRNMVLNDYQQSARSRGHAWELGAEDFHRLILMNCFYCGRPPRHRVRYRGYAGAYNGVDRIDSSDSYRLGNVLPACAPCNRGKNDMGYSDYLDYLDELADYRIALRAKAAPPGELAA